MALTQATKFRETTYTINDAMDVLLSGLDEAIDDERSCAADYGVLARKLLTEEIVD